MHNSKFEVYIMYIYYIHSELRIENRRFGSGKGAEPLWREHRGSTEGVERSTKRAGGSTKRAGGSTKRARRRI